MEEYIKDLKKEYHVRWLYIIIMISYFIGVCMLCYYAGKQHQLKDNIRHGVMTEQGKWLPEFKMAGYDE